MTQEEKLLLLKDLCGRIDTGTMVNYWEPTNLLNIRYERRVGELKGIDTRLIDTALIERNGCSLEDAIETVKPYLRPMSSLVGKELDECRATCKYRQVGQSVLDCATPETIDYLNAHHFDYRGLIPAGLALEAPEGMYKPDTEEEEVKVEIPNTLEEALAILDKIVSEEDKEYIKKHGAISVHLTLGMWIRNNWGFWENSDFYKYLCEKTGLTHPDDISNYIIEEFIKWKLDK